MTASLVERMASHPGFEAKVGRGVTGLIEGERAALGNAAILGELGLTAGPLEAASELLKSKDGRFRRRRPPRARLPTSQ